MNPMADLLIALDISDAKSFEPFWPRTRDRDDVQVLKCRRSGVLFLDRCDHLSENYYSDQNQFSYWNADNLSDARATTIVDDKRRADQFATLLKNKDVLDFGAGNGGFLQQIRPHAKSVTAIEQQIASRNAMIQDGLDAFPDLSSVHGKKFDTITFFHVLEHLPDPLTILHQASRLLKPRGSIIIEVPHACDALIQFYESKSFKDFTFWSEHLILHTAQSLTKLIEKAGFTVSSFEGFQRYPITNHLHWLAKGEPGGHERWKQLYTDELEQKYEEMLKKNHLTDTIIAVAQLP